MTPGGHERRKLFERTLSEFGDGLWRLTSGYASDESDREDLQQDILLAIWKSLDRFRHDSSLRTFVYRIAHNRGLSHRSYEKRRTHPSLGSVVVPDPRPDPQESAERKRRREVLVAAIRKLAPSLRQPIMLHLDGFTNPEIAEVVGITEGNVAVRLTRARRAVERTVREEEGE